MMEKYEIQKLRELPIEKVAKEMGMKVEGGCKLNCVKACS